MANWKNFSKVHKSLYRLTNGMIGARMGGLDMALVDTIGRKSGEARTIPIACYRYKDSIVISASNNGLAKNPVWYLNLKENPRVTVQLGRERFQANAEDVTGEERDALWETVTQLNPLQAEHQAKTDRLIPLVWLKRIQ